MKVVANPTKSHETAIFLSANRTTNECIFLSWGQGPKAIHEGGQMMISVLSLHKSALGFRHSCLANRASILLREPLFYATYMIAMTTFQFSHFIVGFIFFLYDRK